MGADMLLYCCEDPTSYRKAWPMIEYRISNMSDCILDSIADEHLWYDAEEIDDDFQYGETKLSEDDLYKLNDLRDIKVRNMVRNRLMEAVREIIGSPEDDFSGWRRDIAHMSLNGVSYIFSGGMSWGDQPSEACEYINLIDCSGLFDGMGKADFDYESFKA